MRYLVITVGVGQDVAHAISYAVRRNKPDRVYYLVTEESAQKTLPEVKRYHEESGFVPPEEFVVWLGAEEKDDLGAVFERVKSLIQDIRKEDRSQPDIVLDFTSGTKIMSAGAVMAACLGGVASLTYVSGRREEGRVASGTERLVEQSLLPYRLEDRERLLLVLFDRYDFSACLQVLQEIRRESAEKRVRDFVSQWERVIIFYHRWDLFDHQSCEPKGAIGIPPRNKGFLGKLRGSESPQKEFYLLADLINNAQRRREEGRFDDAVARLYRAVEFVAQLKLKERGIDTSDVQLATLPPSLQEKYQKFQDEKGLVRLPLFRSFELLQDLGEPLGKQFFSDHELRNLLESRNHSILAHGTESVSEAVFQAMFVRVKEYAGSIVKNLEKLCQEASFPKHEEVLWELEKGVKA